MAKLLGSSTNESIDLVALNDSKSRIITYDSAEVVEALILFWEKDGTLEKEQKIMAYKKLTQLMRSSLGYKQYDILDL
ncbi:hypothetical protein ACRRN1_003576 [Proteus mirabilis]|uniref:hypothetical protein n=1 Tax=Proteus terrae TaxID=1574161 RepID=UPI0022465B46|nr:hypothetical protein [Proteus terrae]MCW9688029.1 hypothetical protein [Proteus terrae]